MPVSACSRGSVSRAGGAQRRGYTCELTRSFPLRLSVAREYCRKLVKIWRTALLVYRELDVVLRVDGSERHFHQLASDQELVDALDSFRRFPHLVSKLTGGRAGIEYEIVRPDHPLASLTRESPSRFWPSPDDIRSDLDSFVPPGKYDSIFVFWPQRNLKNGAAVPCDAWGLAMGASKATNGATYAAIANAPSSAWTNEARGEVWLHEWLHGVCAHFAQRGHVMPERDADGGELHGYVRSPTTGWTDYYCDLMSGNVLEDGKRFGIPSDAWVA